MANSWSRSIVVAICLVGCANWSLGATLLVPAYFDPYTHAADWTSLTSAAARGASVTAIFNPNSGPGTAADAGYTSVLASFRAAGGKAIAYVHTLNFAADGSSTLRKLSDVENEIDAYRSFYAFDGVFVDEMSGDTDSTTISFYSSLYSFIKGRKASYQVVGNPGTNVAQSYGALADVLVTYEDTKANLSSYTPSRWTTTKSAAGFASIVYSTPAANLSATLQQIAAQNAGNVYVTDDGADGNPYDSLPTYWQAEVTAALPEPATLGAMSFASLFLLRRHGRKVRSAKIMRVA